MVQDIQIICAVPSKNTCFQGAAYLHNINKRESCIAKDIKITKTTVRKKKVNKMQRLTQVLIK